MDFNQLIGFQRSLKGTPCSRDNARCVYGVPLRRDHVFLASAVPDTKIVERVGWPAEAKPPMLGEILFPGALLCPHGLGC